MSSLLEKSWKKNKLKWKIVLLVLLCIAFFTNLIVIAVQKHDVRKERERSEVEDGNVPESGTQNLISNLEEYAVPVMGEQTNLLTDAFFSFLKKEHVKEQETEIIHVMIPEDEPEKVLFFFHLKENNSFLELAFDRKKEKVSVKECRYTKEEILAEVWEGIEPESKDFDENESIP